ncbi:MAG: hypothetical protein KJ787_10775 [Gammaproteobacteria bacterium]|nr:hypothetical protein [Gammaproteobacteria bacterium]MBU1646806.1 hypothetical protein [Gammaproteobacteria bacterium]MBU1971641.1 hypothetical protein [Gammaproteobacteria bacterium]
MNTYTIPSTQPTGTIIHQDFMGYVAVNQEGVKDFLKAIAINGVVQAITLAAVGIKVKAMIMPNMSRAARCHLALPKAAWVNNLKWMQNESRRQARYLEVVCWKISGAVAEFAFDEYDHYGSLGLGDIEGSYDFLSAYEAAHNVSSSRILAGCTVVVERLFGQHFDVTGEMAEHLFKQGNLAEPEINRYLSGVQTEELGQQVLATLPEPWIDDEAERVHRMFIGS